MSVTLYIMRHGIAEERAVSGEDADRRLTKEGRHKVVAIAAGLKAMGVKPAAILSSPLPRAMETAALAAAVLDRDAEVEIARTLAIGYDATAVVAALEGHRDADSLMLVGHQPQLGEVVSYLLTGSPSAAPFPFKKGGVAAVEVDTLPLRCDGTLLWFMTPKQLWALG